MVNPNRTQTRNLCDKFLGFCFGIALSIGLYYLFTTQFKVEPVSAKWTFSAVGVVLAFACAYSEDVRCTIFLMLPTFCTKRGRTALLAYAFILSLTGPAKNIALNMEVIGHTLSCAEEELKEALNDILTVIKTPFVAIKQAIARVLQHVKEAADKVEKIVMKIVRVIHKILDIIGKAFAWLHKVVNVCNTKMGTPLERCQKMFVDTYNECKDTMGAMGFMCGNIDNTKVICHSLKLLDHICSFLDTVHEEIVSTVKKGLHDYYENIRKIFYVSVKIDHKYYFKTKASKKYKTVLSDILEEIDRKVNQVLKFFRFSTTLGMIFFIWMVVKAERYRRNYLSNDRFDNIYITQRVLNIDNVYVKAKREPLLPLKENERKKYIKPTSFRIADTEKFKVFKALAMVMISTIQILMTLATDYSLYWLLYMVRYYGQMIDATQETKSVSIHVKGEGILADMCKGIVDAFDPFTKIHVTDSVPCLPNPLESDYSMYKRIIAMIVIVWLTLLLEPFGLRVRQVILGSYYPERAEERAIWLYNDVMGSRTLFVRVARKHARQKFLKDKAGLHGYNFGWLRWWKRIRHFCTVFKHKCKLCENTFVDPSHLIECVRNCNGKYCFDCFDRLNGTCPLCMDPVTYDDFSDYSEEWGSTDEEDYHVARYLTRVRSKSSREKFQMKLS